MPFELVNSETNAWRESSDSRPDFKGLDLVAFVPISLKIGCYEEPEVGAPPCNLSWSNLIQRHGENGRVQDVTSSGHILWPVFSFYEIKGAMKSQRLGQHHSI